MKIHPMLIQSCLSALLSVLSFSFSSLVFAQSQSENPVSDLESAPSSLPAEESEAEVPELPDSELILPEEDPRFQPDPNQLPLEEDFNRMLPTRNPWFWRLELRNHNEYNSNVDQIAGGLGGYVNRTLLTGILRYTFPSNTQILLRSQGFWFNHPGLTGRNQLLGIPLSATVSQWFGDSFNLYSGWIPILSTSLGRNPDIQRFDHNFMAGGTWYQFFENKHILYIGYQMDYLSAQATDFSYLGNLLFAGYRHNLRDDLFLFVDARLQPRGYTATSEFLDEVRFGGGLALQWHITRPWFIIEARSDYNQVINWVDAQRSTGIFSIGLNLITAIQSES